MMPFPENLLTFVFDLFRGFYTEKVEIFEYSIDDIAFKNQIYFGWWGL